MPAARQNRSKLADTSSQALPTAPIFVEGNAVGVVLILFMALISFRGISTPSLPAQGEKRRFFYFNIQRDNPEPCRSGHQSWLRAGLWRRARRRPAPEGSQGRGREAQDELGCGRGRRPSGAPAGSIC